MLSRSQRLILFALLISVPTTSSEAGFATGCRAFFSSVTDITQKLGRVASYPGDKLNELYARLRLRGKLNDFDLELFDEATLRFRTHPEALPPEGVIEEEIAYWEAQLRNLPERDKTPSLRPTLKSDNWKDKYLLYRSIRGEAYDPIAYFRSIFAMHAEVRGSLDPLAMRTEQISRFIDDVYLLNHFEMGPKFRDLFGSKGEIILEKKLRNLAWKQVDQIGLEKFFYSRGAITNAAVGDLAKEFTESDAWAATVFALTNLGIGSGLLGVAPKLEFTRGVKKWGPRFYRDGIPAHWDDFLKEFRDPQRMGAGYDAFRAAWMAADR